ncbi:hypothetical protein WJX84_010428 [Apatococcus fuscideae]|uniref:F-box domain-containing protein n=1 Tax=Apatococcus fuscideae TaxID=2026836 RepID=A0AAW1SUD3_9CHLO
MSISDLLEDERNAFEQHLGIPDGLDAPLSAYTLTKLDAKRLAALRATSWRWKHLVDSLPAQDWARITSTNVPAGLLRTTTASVMDVKQLLRCPDSLAHLASAGRVVDCPNVLPSAGDVPLNTLLLL